MEFVFLRASPSVMRQGGPGRLRNPQNASPGWNVTRFAAASVDMYVSIVPGDATMCDMKTCTPKPVRRTTIARSG